MKIIKEAFDEGRETDINWDKSKAKKNELKFNIALENFSSMSQKEKNAKIALAQICPQSGKTLKMFSSRLMACKYICENVLKNPNKNPLSVTGNLEMCIRAGWKSYGYYWKIVDYEEEVKKMPQSSSSSVRVKVIVGIQVMIFDSITDASKFIGINRDTLSNNIKSGYTYVFKHKQFYGLALINDDKTNNYQYKFHHKMNDEDIKKFYKNVLKRAKLI